MPENYDDIPELKVIINKTRKKLKRLTDYDQGNKSEEILELSRKLDILIHYYISLELALKS
ncbi:MAG: Spo0E family sporulation regulatory protein-aspartic acid phosphatase [Lutisporaceae bacterium]